MHDYRTDDLRAEPSALILWRCAKCNHKLLLPSRAWPVNSSGRCGEEPVVSRDPNEDLTWESLK